MIVLDTNIVSEIQKPAADIAIEMWFRNQAVESVYLCAPVLMEQAFGAERFFLRTGSPRYLDRLKRTIEKFGGRMLAFDVDSSSRAGALRAIRESVGRPISIGDAMIAAICIVHGATLATRNVRDFDGLDLKLVNPFEAGA